MSIFKPVVFCLFLVGAFVLALTMAAPVAKAAHGTPSAGWTIHIDAEKHFPNHQKEVAHHWCRAVAGAPGMLECQLYASDDNNAPLVGTEVIVSAATYKSFSLKEQAMWHYHKTEIPKVNAKMPDVSAVAAKKMVAALTETYGKNFILWDPMDNKLPIGQPVVGVPH
jgi:hypothetical protein